MEALREQRVVAIGRRIQQLRERLPKERRSRERLAHAAGISHQTLFRLERGETARPSLDTLLKISDALGVSVGELMVVMPETPTDEGD